MAGAALKMFRVSFSSAEFHKLPPEDQLFIVRLAQVTDDLRSIQYLCVAAERGTRSKSPNERALALHQLLFGVRLLYSTVHEAMEVIRTSWNGLHGKRWDMLLTDKGRAARKQLNKYFAHAQNIATQIRNSFGFHYSADPLREAVTKYPHKDCDILTGYYSANVFYPFAEEIRARAMMQAAAPAGSPNLLNAGVSEKELRAGVVELYTLYRKPLEAFQAFANDFLIASVKTLKPKSKQFTVRRAVRFRRMKSILFVEEPAVPRR